ncbi:hypothetical protein U1Q18_022277, partial [Sarracenia purpurea var. burkii]
VKAKPRCRFDIAAVCGAVHCRRVLLGIWHCHHWCSVMLLGVLAENLWWHYCRWCSVGCWVVGIAVNGAVWCCWVFTGCLCRLCLVLHCLESGSFLNEERKRKRKRDTSHVLNYSTIKVDFYSLQY